MKTIAFVCVHNSCRSQMAEAIAKKNYSQYNFISFGTELKNEINPTAIEILKKYYNLDISSSQKPKTYNDVDKNIDYVILMGCNVSCPIIESKYSENWNLDDPTGKDEKFFLEITKKIEEKLYQLIKKIENKLI